MSNDLNLRRIKFKDPLRSRPVRLNFNDIENEYNSLRAEVYASIASTASEVTSARNNFSNLNDNINVRKVYGNGFSSSDYVSELTVPDMKVRVSSGTGIINGIGIDWSSGTSATISAPSSGNHRVDVVTVNTDNTITVEPGTATATSNQPSIPALGATQDQLAFVYLTAGTSSLQEKRNIFNVKPKSDVYEDFVHAVDGSADVGIHDFNNLVIIKSLHARQKTGPDSDALSYMDTMLPSALAIRTAGDFFLTNGASINTDIVVDHDYFKTEANNGADGSDGTGGAGGSFGYQSVPSFLMSALSGRGGKGGSGSLGNGCEGGGGGGGAGAIFSSGGDGASGPLIGAGGAPSATGGEPVNGGLPLWIVCGGKVAIDGSITTKGQNGNEGDTEISGTNSDVGGAGGSGGGNGGNIVIASQATIHFSTTADISTEGGRGGKGGDASTTSPGDACGGSGGGGGAGGTIWARGTAIINNGSQSADGGAGGTAGFPFLSADVRSLGNTGADGGDGKITIKAYQPSNNGFQSSQNSDVSDGYMFPIEAVGFIGEY
jgi:hypothetical protein